MARNASLCFHDLNSSPFAELLRHCIHLCSLLGARRVHCRLLKSPFSSEIFIHNRLIDAYAKCGSLNYAQKVFDQMPHKNTFSWNTLIVANSKAGCISNAVQLFETMPERDQCSWNSMVSGFAQHGWFADALDSFSRMHGESWVLGAHALSSTLNACAGLPDSKMGSQIHGLICKYRLHSDVIVGSALVDMYSKCGRPAEAREVFDDMPEKNVVTWNSLITCYEQNGPAREALVVFEKMMDSGMVPDEMTFASVVSACASLSDVKPGSQIHAKVMKCDKLRNDIVLNNAFVDMYSKCGRLEYARTVFDRMPLKNVISETSMISGYAKFANVEDAKLMFSRMTDKNVVAWNALIAGYTQSGNNEEALKLFHCMKREPIWPTHYTFGNILSACANLADLRLGQQTHANVLKHGFHFMLGQESDVFVGNSLIDMYLKCGSVEDGSKVFKTMISKDLVSWNAMIVGHAQNGRGEEAIDLFKRMLASGEEPDHVTMIGVLSGCSHAGLVEDGRRYFKSMTEEYHLVPSRDHYTCMVDLLGRSGHLKEAADFIKQMPMEPDSILWGSVLASCRVHRNFEMGEFAAKRLFELNPENSGPYVLLSNMHADAGRWSDVVRLRKLMKQKGVVKQPGCSWVELDMKVHVFLARDKRHSQMNEIYCILESLRLQMKKARDFSFDFSTSQMQI